MNVKELLQTKPVILDGAMGTVLQKRGLAVPGALPEVLSITKANELVSIHRSYIESGAQIIYANTFGANSYKAKDSGYTVAELVSAGIKNAKKAALTATRPPFFPEEQENAFVALDIGPIGRLMQPNGDMTENEAYLMFQEVMSAGVKAGADCIVLETMTDLLEIKTALLAAKELDCSSLTDGKIDEIPVLCTMTFEDSGRTFVGVTPAAAAITLSALGADAIGMNCSLGPKQVFPIVKELCAYTNKPVIVKPNAGLPDPVTNDYDIDAFEFAQVMKDLIPLGVSVYGGCCGTTFQFITELSKVIHNTFKDNVSFGDINTSKDCNSVLKKQEQKSFLCSFGKVVTVDRPLITGERINPTGKKLFKEALVNHNIDYVLKQGLAQIEAGADILDVNVGVPGLDEVKTLVEVVTALQSVSDIPLQLDSSDPKALEAALRIYSGKPLVNSVNGEKKSLDSILPLVKKYGAAVVCLTLDENGIPQTAEERFAIAKRIVERADSLGISRSDLYVDCLTLTVSAEQNQAVETLKALRMVKENLGVKTTLGVSNISFGLPNRELITRTFLTMALETGLDLAIINPNKEAMSGTIKAFNVLHSYDESSRSYVEAYKDWKPLSKSDAIIGTSAEQTQGHGTSQITDSAIANDSVLFVAVQAGLKMDAKNATKQLIAQDVAPMEIVEKHLIPALDAVGTDFETGRLFLPQLIQSASAAQESFSVIRSALDSAGKKSVSKGTIVIATVKGDVHDIGKNIVKVLLQNYGYNVIDCGKNVPPQTIVDAVIKYDCKLCGLSALMTTTLSSMQETINLIHEQKPDCKVMVGGAVLTEDYAKTIQADFYGKDAQSSVAYANLVFGNHQS
ncbi:MAG: homocysteine methyltransferase [Treponema sp. CETP13]|nr:MAG: homocysteine methyltransferase [Treponema sp. CETP13]